MHGQSGQTKEGSEKTEETTGTEAGAVNSPGRDRPTAIERPQRGPFAFGPWLPVRVASLYTTGRDGSQREKAVRTFFPMPAQCRTMLSSRRTGDISLTRWRNNDE